MHPTDTCVTIHLECLEKPLQPYGIFADIQKHYELGDLKAALHVLPIANGKYYLREDVDKLLGRVTPAQEDELL